MPSLPAFRRRATGPAVALAAAGTFDSAAAGTFEPAAGGTSLPAAGGGLDYSAAHRAVRSADPAEAAHGDGPAAATAAAGAGPAASSETGAGPDTAVRTSVQAVIPAESLMAGGGDIALAAAQVRAELFGEVTPGWLSAESITAWFGDTKVLDRVSLQMPAGIVTALIGPSGCGKSTFLRILNRLHEKVPSARVAGEILLDGQDVYDQSQRVTDVRRHIGMVFQKPNPFPAESIYDNVLSGLVLSRIRATREQRNILVEHSLRQASLWDEVKDRLEQPGAGLSGGQQQRLCIARALAVTPRVLLMDEPCSALDPTSTRKVEETIADLRGQVTIVIVTHNMQQAARVSDQCAFFLAAANRPGVIVEYGDTEAMFGSPQDGRTLDYVNGRFG